MNTHRCAVQYFVAGMILLLATGFPYQTLGQDNSGNSGKSNYNGNAEAKSKSAPGLADRPQIVGSESKASGNDNGKKLDKPERTSRPDQSVAVKEMVKQFQSARENYLKEQNDIKRLSKNATEEQRAALREQMKESLERWKEEQKQLRQEMQERAKELKQELQSDLGRVVDGGKGEGREK